MLNFDSRLRIFSNGTPVGVATKLLFLLRNHAFQFTPRVTYPLRRSLGASERNAKRLAAFLRW
jgi:hypothetical protein